MSALAFHNEASTDDFRIEEGALDIHVRQAVGRMLDWCARSPQGAAFMARGLIIDTLGDIGEQVRGYFPIHINTSPVMDDVAFVVGQAAQKSGQRFQEISLDYIGDGKIPQAARANMQSFVKWYGVEATAGGDFDGHDKKLRPGWSGGAGAPTDMLKYLNLGSKKGFLLQVCALDIRDAKAQSLLADMAMVQAFGGAPAAIEAVADALIKGGADAASVQKIVGMVVEIKTIRAALINAGDTPQAAPAAAALALKVETFTAQITALKMPAAVRAEIVRMVSATKTDLQVRQIAQVVTTLATQLPASSPMRRAAEAIQTIARAADLPVRDAIALTISREAPAPIVEAVKAMTVMLAKPDALPTIEKALPPQAAKAVRQALTVPAPEAMVATPVSLQAVAQTIRTIAAAAPEVATIKMAATVLEQAAMTPPTMRAPAVQSVAENLQAVAFSSHVPADVKPALQVAVAQAEVLTVQARTPAPQPQTQPAPLHQQAPLAVLARAVDVTPPASVPPMTINAQPQAAPAPAAKGFDFAKVTITPANTNTVAGTTPTAKADTPKAGGRCAGCFNKSCAACGALNQKVIDAMKAEIAAMPNTLKPKVT